MGLSDVEERIVKARMVAISDAIRSEIRDGMVVGIGSGKTIEMLIKEVGAFLRSGGLGVVFVPSSYRSQMLLLNEGLRTASLFEYPIPDLYLDSFDEADERGNFIKGGGGAMTREKILSHAAKRVVFIADYAKLKESLGMPVPIEVLPFGLPHVKKEVERLGGKLRLREGTGKFGPVFSDNGNMIADVDLGTIKDPPRLERELKCIPGVVENGIFTNVCHVVYVGMFDGSIKRMDYR